MTASSTTAKVDFTCPRCGNVITVLWRGVTVCFTCRCGMAVRINGMEKIGELFPWMRPTGGAQQ